MIKSKESIAFDLPDADVEFYPNFLTESFSDKIFKELLTETSWRHDDITIFGKTYKQPRLTALYSIDGIPYSYSNITMIPESFTGTLLILKTQIEKVTGHAFTTCLLNLYRNGNDSNGWHADDEKSLRTNPVIASLSLGASRNFKLKHHNISSAKKDILLTHGSLLIMQGTTQHYWKHHIPKTKKTVGPRINLTFRKVY